MSLNEGVCQPDPRWHTSDELSLREKSKKVEYRHANQTKIY